MHIPGQIIAMHTSYKHFSQGINEHKFSDHSHAHFSQVIHAHTFPMIFMNTILQGNLAHPYSDNNYAHFSQVVKA